MLLLLPPPLIGQSSLNSSLFPNILQTQEEEVIQLRNAITDHKREETGLLQQVAERRSRVEAVENENKAISSRNDLVSVLFLLCKTRFVSRSLLFLLKMNEPFLLDN